MRFCCDGIGQRLRDMLLADDVRETLRAIFAGYDLIGHSELRVGVQIVDSRIDMEFASRFQVAIENKTEMPG